MPIDHEQEDAVGGSGFAAGAGAPAEEHMPIAQGEVQAYAQRRAAHGCAHELADRAQISCDLHGIESTCAHLASAALDCCSVGWRRFAAKLPHCISTAKMLQHVLQHHLGYVDGADAQTTRQTQRARAASTQVRAPGGKKPCQERQSCDAPSCLTLALLFCEPDRPAQLGRGRITRPPALR